MNRTDAALFAGLLPNPAVDADALGRRACPTARTKECTAIRAAAATLVSDEYAARLDPGLPPHPAVRLLDKPRTRITPNNDRRNQYPPRHEQRRVEKALVYPCIARSYT